MKKLMTICSIVMLMACVANANVWGVSDGSEIPWGTISDGVLGFEFGGGSSYSRVVVDSPEAPQETSGTYGVFNFNPALTDDGTPGYDSGHFFQPNADQFRLEMEEGPSALTFNPVDWDGASTGVVNTSQTVNWTLTNSYGVRKNSLFRGSVIEFTPTFVSTSPTTWDIEGKLYTDGMIHWYGDINNNGTYLDDDTSDLTNWDLADYFVFRGTIIDIDNGASAFDLYANSGDMEFYAVAVPEPATMSLLALGGIALIRRKRKA